MTLLRRTVVCSGVALAVSVSGAAASQAAEARTVRAEAPPARTSALDTRGLHRAATATSPGWLVKLLRRAVKPVARWVIRKIRGEAVQLTHDEVSMLFCDGWRRYFGYDRNRWAQATWVDWRARWAWHYCAGNGY